MPPCVRFIVMVLCLSMAVIPSMVYATDAPFPAVTEEREIILDLRNNFQYALEDPQKNEDLIAVIEKHYIGDPLDFPATILAYYGSLIGLRAKHAFMPNQKLLNLKKSLNFMDAAVAKNDAGLEAHFLRFSSLHHMPSLLSIPRKRREDIAQILVYLQEKDYSLVNKAFQKIVIEFLLQSKRLNKEQLRAAEILKQQIGEIGGHIP